MNIPDISAFGIDVRFFCETQLMKFKWFYHEPINFLFRTFVATILNQIQFSRKIQ